ncbi:MAG: DUF1684 domain-containing protein [Anaerolineaceae bacterium]
MKTNSQSWLALIGLFQLEEGDNSFGTRTTNKIILPQFNQEQCGSFHRENGKISLTPINNSNLTINKMSPGPLFLCTDRDEEPDRIEIGSLTMMILQRGDNFLLRVWDGDSMALKGFAGLKYFPVNEKYRIMTKFITYDPPRAIRILDVIGTEYEGHLCGEAHFTLDGADCSLVAEEDGDELLFSFTDKTREDMTYPGGRFLVAAQPRKNCVILDFNQAVNWPCAYTSFATCPLPPNENHLAVRIEAGEMRYQE